MIGKDVVLMGLNCKLDYKTLLEIINNHQLDIEKYDYYNCDLYLKIIDKAINKEIDIEYFTAWCVLAMASLNEIPVKYRKKKERELYEDLSWYLDGVAFLDEYDVYELKKIKAEVRYFDHRINNAKKKKNDLYLSDGIARYMLYDHANPCFDSDVYRTLVLDFNKMKFSYMYFDEYMYEYKDDINYSFVDNEELFDDIFCNLVLNDGGWVEETHCKDNKYFVTEY